MKRINMLFMSIIMLLSMSSIAFAAELDLDTQTEDAVIGTQVPVTHEIKLQTDGNGKVFYNGSAADKITVDRMSEPTILIRGESNYVIDTVTLDDQEITEKIKGGYYTFDKIHKDSLLKVSFKTAERGNFSFHFVGTIHKNGVPLANTKIELRSALKASRTDQAGRFAFSDVEDGHHSLTALDDNGKIIAYAEFRFIRDKTVSGVEIKKNTDDSFDIRVNTKYVILNLEFNQTDDGKLEVVKGTATNNKEDISNFPQTGDNTPIIPYVLLAFCSLGAIAVVTGKRKF